MTNATGFHSNVRVDTLYNNASCCTQTLEAQVENFSTTQLVEQTQE